MSKNSTDPNCSWELFDPIEEKAIRVPFRSADVDLIAVPFGYFMEGDRFRDIAEYLTMTAVDVYLGDELITEIVDSDTKSRAWTAAQREVDEINEALEEAWNEGDTREWDIPDAAWRNR